MVVVVVYSVKSAASGVTAAAAAASPDEADVAARVKALEESLAAKIEHLKTVRASVPDQVENIMLTFLQSQVSQPAGTTASTDSIVAALRQMPRGSSSSARQPLEALAPFHYESKHYSAEDVSLLEKNIKHWSLEVQQLAHILPKRLVSLQHVRTYLQNDAGRAYSSVEQLMLEDTADDPTRLFAPLKRKTSDPLDDNDVSKSARGHY